LVGSVPTQLGLCTRLAAMYVVVVAAAAAPPAVAGARVVQIGEPLTRARVPLRCAARVASRARPAPARFRRAEA
jgi:hypothetical protein